MRHPRHGAELGAVSCHSDYRTLCWARRFLICVVGALAWGTMTPLAAQAPPASTGVLEHRPLSALCGGDPDIVRYYQRERRAIWLMLEPRIGAVLTPLQELDASDAFMPSDRQKAGRLAQRLVAVRSELERLVPTLADADDAAFLAALERAATPGTNPATVYPLLDSFLVHSVVIHRQLADWLPGFINRIAELKQQLALLESGREDRAGYLKASISLRLWYQDGLKPTLDMVLDTTTGLQSLQNAASSWCEGHPQLSETEPTSKSGSGDS